MLSNSMNSESLNVNFKTNFSRWNPKRKNEFVCNINEDSIRNLDNILDNIGTANANPHDVQSQLDNALGHLCECLHSAADKTFKPYSQHRIHDKPISNTKPWFKEKCHSKRRFYNKSKRVHKIRDTLESEQNRKKCFEEFKKMVRNEHSKYKKSIENKLRNLKKSDPKSFWKEISIKNAKYTQYGDISLDDFAKHFETLNLDESAHVVEINPHQSTDTGATVSSNITVNAVNDIVEQTMNNILNRPFISSEIINTIKSLKNNKAVGIDSIRN